MDSILMNLLDNVFYNDGSLRDIYVLDTNIGNWEIFWNFIQTEFKIGLYIDGERSKNIPDNVADIFDTKKDKAIFLRIDYQDIEIMCHFFSVEIIELDISPVAIKNTNQAKTVIEVMDKISKLLSKEISISLENDIDAPLITITSEGKRLAHYK